MKEMTQISVVKTKNLDSTDDLWKKKATKLKSVYKHIRIVAVISAERATLHNKDELT